MIKLYLLVLFHQWGSQEMEAWACNLFSLYCLTIVHMLSPATCNLYIIHDWFIQVLAVSDVTCHSLKSRLYLCFILLCLIMFDSLFFSLFSFFVFAMLALRFAKSLTICSKDRQ